MTLFIFILIFQFIQDLENKPCWPVGHTPAQSQCNRSCLQDFLATNAEVNSTADMIFYSTIAAVANTDPKRDEFFVFLG